MGNPPKRRGFRLRVPRFRKCEYPGKCHCRGGEDGNSCPGCISDKKHCRSHKNRCHRDCKK